MLPYLRSTMRQSTVRYSREWVGGSVGGIFERDFGAAKKRAALQFRWLRTIEQKRKYTDTIYMLNESEKEKEKEERENDNSNQANSPKFIVHSKRQSQSS